MFISEAVSVMPTRCPICGEPVLLVAELAPAEAMGAVLCGTSMCPRHWSNFAQGMANSHGLSLLRSEESHSLSD